MFLIIHHFVFKSGGTELATDTLMHVLSALLYVAGVWRLNGHAFG